MFTITDEDRALREEGQNWRERCKANLTQHPEKFTYRELVGADDHERGRAIYRNSFGAILQERTALVRRLFRADHRPGKEALVRVLVSQRAVEEALAEVGLQGATDENVRRLIASFVSDDFVIQHLRVNYMAGTGGLEVPMKHYTSFMLAIPA